MNLREILQHAQGLVDEVTLHPHRILSPEIERPRAFLLRVTMNKKVCKDCSNEYEPTGSHQYRCRPCGVAKEKAWNKEYDKRRNLKNKGKTRYRKFKITEEQFNKIFEEQEGKCAICGKHQTQFNKALAIDHCHVTKEVRGLLCHNCNVMLGFANDDVDVLLAAVKYLSKRLKSG